MWTIYILLCDDESFYTGITNDLPARFEKHKSGKASKYTRSHKPIRIVYQERVESKSDALKRELEIKNLSKSEKKQLITEYSKEINQK